MESNAFKTESRATVLLGALAAGLATMVAVFALDPFGPPVVLLSWCFALAGLALAVIPGASRALGFGLALAGVVPPFAVFLLLWSILSVASLDGSLS